MESCTAVERELEKVFSKFSGLQEHCTKNLEELCSSIQNIQRKLSDEDREKTAAQCMMIDDQPMASTQSLITNDQPITATQSLILTQTVRRIKEAVSRFGQEHKDLHGTVSKVGKSIDRNFVNDLTPITTDGAFEGTEKTHLLNEVVSEHFMRQGMLDIADALIEEAGLEIAEEKKEPFLELHRILGGLKQKNLEPALSWATANKERLREINSCLEFKLHRLKFIDLLRQGCNSQTEALYYSRHLAQFANQYPRDLQVLMGSMLYLRQGIENSPYAYLVAPIYWDEICDVFTRDACCLLGMSVESPLSVSIRAGCLALPPLLNIRQVMQQRQVSGVWSSKDELPVEIDLGKDYRYHSTFACPILRQQTTDANPPMRLICGHVISKDALTKLSNGTKVKCPYCPIEQLPMEAKQIFF